MHNEFDQPSLSVTNTNEAITARAWTIAHSLQKWTEEHSALCALLESRGSLGKRKLVRLGMLSSAIESYAECSPADEELPVYSWIKSANRPCSN